MCVHFSMLVSIYFCICKMWYRKCFWGSSNVDKNISHLSLKCIIWYDYFNTFIRGGFHKFYSKSSHMQSSIHSISIYCTHTSYISKYSRDRALKKINISCPFKLCILMCIYGKWGDNETTSTISICFLLLLL